MAREICGGGALRCVSIIQLVFLVHYLSRSTNLTGVYRMRRENRSSLNVQGTNLESPVCVFIVSVTQTYSIVISEYFIRYGFSERPQVRYLASFCLKLTHFDSYQLLTRLSVLEPPMHTLITDTRFCSRIPIVSYRAQHQGKLIMGKVA